MLFDNLPVARNPRDVLSHKNTGGDKSSDKKRRAHILHSPRAKSFDVEAYYAAHNVPLPPVTRYVAGKAQGCDELTKKRAGAVGMMEGWREVLNEPVRQRVGLLQMSAHYNVER